jgi:hypothetical protein
MLQAGKKVERPALRQNKETDGLSITFNLRSNDSEHEAQESQPVHRDQDVEDAIARVEKSLPIQVDDQVTRHKFVVSTERALHQSLRSKRRDRDGLVHPGWEFRGPKLGIRVAESSIPRALRIADSLLLGALVSGFQVESITENDRESIRLTVLKEPFQFSITERRRQIPHVLTDREKEQEKKYGRPLWAPKIDYLGTGDLVLSIWPTVNTYSAVTWKDRKRTRLESLIGEILLELPMQVQRLRECREAQGRCEAERRAAEQRRWEEEKRQREERQRVEGLLKEVENWRLAESVRAYRQAITAVIPEGDESDNPAVRAWLEWVDAVADRIDPINSLRVRGSSATPNRPR